MTPPAIYYLIGVPILLLAGLCCFEVSHVFTCKQLIDNLLASPVLCLRLSACSLGVISLFRCVSLHFSPQLRCFFFATDKKLCSQEAWTQTQSLMQGPCRNGLCHLFLPCPFQTLPKSGLETQCLQ